MKKRVLSAILVIAIVASSLALSITAFGSSQELVLDVKKSATISGADDLVWFYYTPVVSGKYSLLSYNVPACECYLFIKEKKADGSKQYVQLAYSCKDSERPDTRQFRLTYYLEAGVTYYYAAGWYLSGNRTDGTMTVMLRNDNYDEMPIESIELGEPVELEAYTDGSWNKDANSNSYFRYNTSKIVANLTITIHYTDGTSVTETGKDVIDGYPVSFIDNQYEEHWYPQEDPNCTGNTFTVKILDITAGTSIPINIGAKYYVKGSVVNMAGEPVKNAGIYLGTSQLAVTDEDGIFHFYSSSGEYIFKIKTASSIDKEVQMAISVSADDNDFTDTPISICNCDYVRDGIVNAKDYSFIKRYAAEDDIPKIEEEFKRCINFTADKY